MARLSLVVWLVYLTLVKILLSTNAAEDTSEKNRNWDLDLLLRYREFVDKFTAKGCRYDFELSNESLVLDYDLWKGEVNLVNNVANYLTSMWRYKNARNQSLVENEATIYSLVRSNALSSENIYGSVICFDGNRFRGRQRFCPYAFKDKKYPNGVRVFDLGVKYDYSNETKFQWAEWWTVAREKALKNKLRSVIENYDINLSGQVNESWIPNADRGFNVTSSIVNSSDGTWTTIYKNCLGGGTWMMSYLAPFFDENNQFLGVVSFDIEVDSIDVNQCDFPKDSRIEEVGKQWVGKVLTFYGTHHCHNKSTKCFHRPGKGFRADNYGCICRKGYYFPDKKAENKYFDGREILKVYKNKKLYNSMFKCLPCRKGCEECIDDTPCMYTLSTSLRITFLALNEVIKALAIALGVFIFVFRERKIIKASSPVFMEIIVLGIILMYFEISIGYLEASVGVCISQSWLYHTGFILAFGSLLLKTWRIVVIFRLRSAKMIVLTDMTLSKYLATMVAVVLVYLMIWTWTNTQSIEMTKTSDGYKFRRCVRGWFSNAIGIGEILFLTWGVWLSLQVRNAPSAYNESKYIAWCIYNTVFIKFVVGLLRLLLDNFHNPDVSFVVDFLSTHVVATIMLVLLFVSKIVLLRKYGKETPSATPATVTTTNSTKDMRKSPFHLNRLVDGSLVHEVDDNRSLLSLEVENMALREEIRSLNAQLVVFENKEARMNKRKGSEPEENGGRSRSLEANQSRALSTVTEKTNMSQSTDGSTTSYGSGLSREEKGGSLLEDIKNAGKTNDEIFF